MKTAKLVEVNLKGWNGLASAYEVTPPIVFHDWDRDAEGTTSYVIVSSIDFADIGMPFMEVAVFAAEKAGNSYEVVAADVLDTIEGGQDHAQILKQAGYTLVLK